MLLFPLMCWEWRDSPLLTSVQPRHRATVSWPPELTGPKYDLCIQRRALELSVKARMWDLCTSCWIVMYIENDKARNSRRFNVSISCHLGGMYQRHAMPLSFHPLIQYLQASDHSLTFGVVNMMLFIGTPISATHCMIFIQRCRSCLYQDWIRCGPHFFPLFSRLRSRFRKHLAGGIIWYAGLSLPMRDSILSVFIFLKDRDALMSCTQAFSFYSSRNTCRERVWMSHPIQVLRLSSWPSPTILRSERGSSRLRGLSEWRGLNMVWIINKAALLVSSTQHGFSMVMEMISYINPSIEASFASIFTAIW